MSRLLRRVHYWLVQRRMAEELRVEIEAHRAHRQDALERAGRADAEAASRRALGNVVLARDDVRDVWIWPWLDSLVRDVQYAMRSLSRERGFAVAAVLTVGIGTAALTSVLAVVHAVLLRPPDYPNADRIVQIAQATENGVRDEAAPVDIAWLAHNVGSFERVTYSWFSSANLSGAGPPTQTRMVYTDANAFSLLGTQPLLGRVPTAAGAAANAPLVVISSAVWQEQWGGDPGVIGATVRVNGIPHVVAAVMPPAFEFPAPYYAPGRIWLLRSPAHREWPDSRTPIVLGFGLLREGRTIEQAQQEVDAAAAALDRLHPADGAIGLRLTRWAERVRAATRPRLMLMLGAAGLLLLIVCVNVANLLLSRGLERRRELAVRAALGAGRVRLARQLVTEVAVLFAVGGMVGVLAAVGGTRAIVSVSSFVIPRMNEASVTLTVAAAGLTIALAVAGITGLVPVLQAMSAGAAGLAAEGARGASRGRAWRRMQQGLIAGEIAIALVLLCGAGVMVEGGWRLSRVDPGFEVDGLVQASLSLPPEKYRELDAVTAFHDRVRERVLSIPGVVAAGITKVAPGLGAGPSPSVLLADGGPLEGDLRSASVRHVGAGYLETLGLEARDGRLLHATDSSDLPVAVVNETFARRYFGQERATGRRIRVALGGLGGLEAAPRTIVGVVGDVREEALYQPVPAVVYVPVAQVDRNAALRMSLVIRSRRPPDELTPLVRAAVADADPEQAINSLQPLAVLMHLGLSLNRLNLVLFSSLSAVSVFLAVVGVYGVTAHGVRQRTREIGIRLALGVTPRGVRRQVLGEGGRLVAAGLGCGLVIAVWAAAWLRSAVYGIDTTSTVTFAVAAILLAAAALGGCYLPAWRAARVDPAIVLRDG